MEIINILIVIGIISFTMGITLDSYSFLVKGYVSNENSRIVISYGNAIQYLSRIFLMITLLTITVNFEQLNNPEALNQIVFIGLSIGILFSLSQINKKGQILMTYVLKPLSYFFFRSIEQEIKSSASNIKLPNLFSRYSILAIVVNILILSAIIVPISLAIIFPDHRMLLTYLGQLFNFFSTAIVLLLVEPILFRQMDSKYTTGMRRARAAEIIFFSKLISYIIVFSIMLTTIKL